MIKKMRHTFPLEITLLLFITIINTCDCHGNSSYLNQSDQAFSHDDICSESSKTRNILFACFAMTVLIVGIIGNTLSIIVILTSRNLRNQCTYHFIVSLATADLGVSLFVTTIKVDMYFHNGSFCHDINACFFLIFVDYLFPMASVIHLFAIAVDRSIAIGLPYFYASNFTKNITRAFILIVWLYAIIWSSLGMFPWHSESYEIQIIPIGELRICLAYDIQYSTTIASVVYFIPMIITTCLYIIIFQIATKHAASIENTSLTKKNRISRRFRRDMKAIKTVSIVFAAYLVCWAPHFIIILLTCWSVEMSKFLKNHKLAYDAVTTLFNNVLPILNSCINPFIYFISSAHFRVAIKDQVYKLFKRPREGIYYPESFVNRRDFSTVDERSFIELSRKRTKSTSYASQ